MKSSALKTAWAAKWYIAAEYAPMPTAKIISPICDIVEYAMTRLMSTWLSAMTPAITAVPMPTHATMPWATGARSNSGWKRAIRYTPAVTMVAAWISAETGVGPSMASGSQVCSGNCALLAKAPMASSEQIPVTSSPLAGNEPAAAKMPGMLSVPDLQDDQEGGDDQGDVADHLGDERLARRDHRARPLVPEADQQVAAQAPPAPSR